MRTVKIVDRSLDSVSLRAGGILKIGTLDKGQFTQDGARDLPHTPEDAGYMDCVVCVCGSELRPCQGCCELRHTDTFAPDSEVCPSCG
jgi:hypothetical protein